MIVFDNIFFPSKIPVLGKQASITAIQLHSVKCQADILVQAGIYKSTDAGKAFNSQRVEKDCWNLFLIPVQTLC